MKEYIYTNQYDGRARVVIVNDGKTTTKSYPRFLMEKELGRELLPNEDVHHKDGDVTNNCLDNLEVILHGEHQRIHSTKYLDSLEVCDVCGKQFIYTAERWCRYYIDLRRGRKRSITCSKSCAGKIKNR